MLRHAFVLACALAVAVPAAQAAEPVSAITFGSSQVIIASRDSTRGFAFTVTATDRVASHLGIWDEDGNGLGASHRVGLWTAGGTLLASTSFAVGAGTLKDGFRYLAITPVPLPVGSYVVAATYAAGDADRQATVLADLTMAPGLTYGGARFLNNVGLVGGVPALTFPDQTFAATGVVGGTLMVTAVPEPSTLALALAGLGVVGWVTRRRRSAAR